MAARVGGQESKNDKKDQDNAKGAPVQLSFEQRLARLSAKIDVAIPAPPAIPPANSVAADDVEEVELAPMSERMATALAGPVAAPSAGGGSDRRARRRDRRRPRWRHRRCRCRRHRRRRASSRCRS